MTLHPSRFPKRADGTRFVVDGDCVIAKGETIATCPTPEIAEMVRAALEFQARDGETFVMEQKPCK